MTVDEPDIKDERGPWRVLMPAVIEEAERAEPPGEPETGLVPLRDPGDVGDPGTADRPGSEGDEIGGAAQAAPPGVAHSSAVMAIGTVFSRATGFLRTVVIGAALGTALLGDAYQAAEMIPYTVYELLLGGLLASVFVPFLVKRRMRDADGGAATERRLLGVVLLALAVLTVAAVLAADQLISLYAGGYEGRQREVAVLLTRLLLVQIFFIGVSGLASTMLNVRRRFGAPMWAPVVNNLITMAAGLVFLWVAGRGRTADTVTDGQLALIGVGSAVGTIAQSAVLAWTLRSAGFRWRPRLDLRGSGLGEAVRAASWMLLYIVVAQVGVLVTANVATRAAERAAEAAGRPVSGSGLATYKFALVVFQLPYAIIAVSVITALLPRMSAHVADGRRDLVRDDFSRGLRLACALLVPLWLGMLVFAIPGSVTFFAYGSLSVDGARRIGVVLMVFAVMVLPFTLHQLLMRIFYALGDTRTPGLIAIPAGIAQAVTAFALLRFVPARQVVLGLPVAYGLFYLAGATGAALVLRRRLGGMDGRRILLALVRLHLAALPAVAFGAAAVWGFGLLPGDRLPALLTVVVGGLGGGALYVGTARLMNVPEIGYFTAMAASRVRRS
ncbi:murein biosynthesis integral membrane protein MurJ [Actinomadura sp. 1N219]|uniref:murein biosynthesis integral membrane protein MurJ n=1 Tax=Actinomadura sp. 1N219 TaxID=3375152 RepID=UPI0037B9D3C0